MVWDQDQETAIRSPHGGPKITWGGPPFDAKTGPNRLRFALSGSLAEIDRLVSLGAVRLGTGENGRVEMADPDGNEFSVVVTR
nr:VOC family protein [Amycolatopsis umgeniensis]